MSSKPRTHRDLEAWREAMALARMIYQATEGFPKSEQFGLSLQLRRAAVSVPSNLAEGAARNTSKEFAQYLSISLGSLAELDTQLQLASDLKWLADYESLERQRGSVARMITKLRQAIQQGTAHRSPITDRRSP